MKAAGWAANDKGCTGDMEDKNNHGAMCMFSRRDGGKEEALAIIIAQDEKLPDTNIVYARIDATQKK